MLAKLSACDAFLHFPETCFNLIDLFVHEGYMEGVAHVLDKNKCGDEAPIVVALTSTIMFCRKKKAEEEEKQRDRVKERETEEEKEEKDNTNQCNQVNKKVVTVVSEQQQSANAVAHAHHLLANNMLSQISQSIIAASVPFPADIISRIIRGVNLFRPRCDLSEECGKASRELVAVLNTPKVADHDWLEDVGEMLYADRQYLPKRLRSRLAFDFE